MAIYDIRTSETAFQTLVNLSGVEASKWSRYVGHEREYEYTDLLVEEVIKSYGHLPRRYTDFEFVYFHITTSANECRAIRKYGILDLQKAYKCPESELRIFLDDHDIFIDTDKCTLSHQGKVFDISYHSGKRTREDTLERYCWAIGRKFYYDYTTCGFLSVWEHSAYGGLVHCRPEILMDIDNLLALNLSQEWMFSHSPYEIVVKVDGNKIIYDGDDEKSDEEKVLDYLTRAYDTAFGNPFEHILLLKNGIQIAPSDIIEIKPLTHWN